MTALLEVRDLAVDFVTDEGRIHAVRDVSFQVEQGACIGVIGESGCGKSVTSLAIMDLLPPTARVVGGEIRFDGRDLLQLGSAERGRLRGSAMAMVFQDAMSALNPVFTIQEQMRDVLRAVRARHPAVGRPSVSDVDRQIRETLDRVGIASSERRMRQYPHELSGGMRQRVLIAMALLSRPRLIIADEPTTALDVTTEAQIVELIRDLVADLGVTFMLITHNLSLVAELCDTVVVLYRGVSVEEAPIQTLFDRPLHPYTRGLMGSILTLDTVRGQLRPIPGSVPSPRERIPGCQFAPRCPDVMAICREARPALAEIEPGHLSACFLHSPAAVEPAAVPNFIPGRPA